MLPGQETTNSKILAGISGGVHVDARKKNFEKIYFNPFLEDL